MSVDVNGLAGAAVTISVGEPWDFESADGPNVLNGVVIGARSFLGSRTGLELSVTPFDDRQRVVSDLFAVNRHEGYDDLPASLATGKMVHVNLIDPQGRHVLTGGMTVTGIVGR